MLLIAGPKLTEQTLPNFNFLKHQLKRAIFKAFLRNFLGNLEQIVEEETEKCFKVSLLSGQE